MQYYYYANTTTQKKKKKTANLKIFQKKEETQKEWRVLVFFVSHLFKMAK